MALPPLIISSVAQKKAHRFLGFCRVTCVCAVAANSSEGQASFPAAGLHPRDPPRGQPPSVPTGPARNLRLERYRGHLPGATGLAGPGLDPEGQRATPVPLEHGLRCPHLPDGEAGGWGA